MWLERKARLAYLPVDLLCQDAEMDSPKPVASITCRLAAAWLTGIINLFFLPQQARAMHLFLKVRKKRLPYFLFKPPPCVRTSVVGSWVDNPSQPVARQKRCVKLDHVRRDFRDRLIQIKCLLEPLYVFLQTHMSLLQTSSCSAFATSVLNLDNWTLWRSGEPLQGHWTATGRRLPEATAQGKPSFLYQECNHSWIVDHLEI